MITDEMVEKLVITINQSLRGWDDKPYYELTPDDWNRAGRAALEAVEPMIAAQTIQRVIDQLYKDGHLSARAQELDPK